MQAELRAQHEDDLEFWIVFIWLLSIKIDPEVAGKCRDLAVLVFYLSRMPTVI